MKFRHPKSQSKEILINLIPLVDVVLLLLIFFMLSTTFITIRQGIKVNLPTTTTLQEKLEENIIISVTKDNRLYIGKKEVKEENLVTLLKKEMKGKESLVLVNADKDVKHGQVVKIMDLAKQAGAYKLGIVTSPEKER